MAGKAVFLAALLLAAFFHFHRLHELPPGRCYDHTTLACFAANVAAGRDPFYGLKDMAGVTRFRYAMSRATLAGSAVIAAAGGLAGIPPRRMDRAETLVEALVTLAAVLLLALLVRAVTASWFLAAGALVLAAVTPGLLLNTRAVPHVLVFPLFFWAAAALGLWLGRRRGRWGWGLAAWAMVGLGGVFFYAGVVSLPLFALLLTWFGASPELDRRQRRRRLAAGAGTALLAWLVPALLLGRGLTGEWLALPRGTWEYWFGMRGSWSPEGVGALALPFHRAGDLLGQLYGGDPPRYLTQAEVDMWHVPGRTLVPWTLQLLVAIALVRTCREKVGRGSPWLWAWGGVLLQPLAVVLTTSGEIRYILPSFLFFALAGALALKGAAGRGEPGILAGPFLLALVLLAAGQGWLTVYHTHAARRWGAQPLFAGLEPVTRALQEGIGPGRAGRDRVLCQRLSHIRYHLALFSDMALCPLVGDFERLLPPTTMEAVKENRRTGVPPALLLRAARTTGLAGPETERLWLLGLSTDPRIQAVARWCGLPPWREVPHPYGGGLRWMIYKVE